MRLINDAQERDKKEWIATVGFFDGVHLGHRFLIDELCRLANEQGLPSAVFTFPRHPRVVLQADYQPKLLNSFEEKLVQLDTTGIDYCALLDFTLELAAYSARDFITFLSNQWRVRTLLIGYDHRFGHHRAEGFEAYIGHGKEAGVEVIQASSCEADTGIISSSKIRRLLLECNVKKASALLTYPYRLKGHIVAGYQIGRKLGFPTANIEINEPFKVLPGMGVYAVWVSIEKKRYKGMLSIGNRPTFEDKKIAIEVHLLHFSETIYQKEIEVEFIDFLRENKKFTHTDDLTTQLENDRKQVDKMLLL